MKTKTFASEDEWLEYEASRGDLAGQPETMPCYACGGHDGTTTVERTVVSLGMVVAQDFDPTQSYILSCGHTAIA